jgi:hypothetical protein
VSAGQRWIISARQDLLWIHGSVVAGLALLWLFATTPPIATGASLAQPALLGVIVWGVLFDGSHVLGTYVRSYWAHDDASRAALPGAWSWSLLAVGPALAGWSGAFSWFLLGAYLWAYYHLVKQHWGFVALYRRRAPASAGPEWLDRALLWTGTLYPYLRYALGPDYASSGLPVLLRGTLAAHVRPVLDGLTLALAATLLVVWTIQVRRGALRPAPQHLLILVVAGFHAAVFAALTQLLAITAALTIFHNLQYHRIVWHYEAGKGRRPLGGLAPYLGAGLLLGVVWYGARVVGSMLAGPSTLGNALVGLGWGVALHHYLVDGRIWRVRRSPGVAAALDAASIAQTGTRLAVAPVLVTGSR